MDINKKIIYKSSKISKSGNKIKRHPSNKIVNNTYFVTINSYLLFSIDISNEVGYSIEELKI